jgi:hypothetical protein
MQNKIVNLDLYGIEIYVYHFLGHKKKKIQNVNLKYINYFLNMYKS